MMMRQLQKHSGHGYLFDVALSGNLTTWHNPTSSKAALQQRKVVKILCKGPGVIDEVMAGGWNNALRHDQALLHAALTAAATGSTASAGA